MIGSALHKARIEVNEHGTEAAAATGLGINVMSMPPQIKFNRPFYYFIVKDDEEVVFAGLFVDPTA